jgi:CheY-like chemotaxis protein
LLTGYADLKAAINAINSGKIFRLLTKPCPSNVLVDALTSGIEQYLKNRKVSQTGDQGHFNGPTKKILVVDDDPVIHSVIKEALNTNRDLEVLTAENGKAAVETLRNSPVDFVITDLKMPVMNGLKLLAFLKRYHPELPAIVLTGHGNPDLETKIEAYAKFKYFEKPLDIGVLIEMIFKGLQSRKTTQIHGIDISAFLQLMDNEQKTCTLKITSGDKIGYLHLSNGDLIAAETETLKAEEAAYRIIGWDDAVMEIDNVCRKSEKEIHLPLMMILMESARIKDEAGGDRSGR